LDRIASGDSLAVDECLDRYGSLVWSLSTRLSATKADAEDAVQEIFIDIWRNAWRFQADRGSEVAFISTIARRRLIDRNRRGNRVIQTSSAVSLDTMIGSDRSSNADNIDEDIEQLKICMRSLRDKDKEIIELAIYAGLSQSQIAERAATPLGTVKTLIRRALVRLRDCMLASTKKAIYG
jgi:RNA polymerase sigma-70 factor (ECF subfamily)